MKRFECGSLVPGCKWHTQAETEADVVLRATEHMRGAHGEDRVRPNLVDEIKARITEVENAA